MEQVLPVCHSDIKVIIWSHSTKSVSLGVICVSSCFFNTLQPFKDFVAGKNICPKKLINPSIHFVYIFYVKQICVKVNLKKTIFYEIKHKDEKPRWCKIVRIFGKVQSVLSIEDCDLLALDGY